MYIVDYCNCEVFSRLDWNDGLVIVLFSQWRIGNSFLKISHQHHWTHSCLKCEIITISCCNFQNSTNQSMFMSQQQPLGFSKQKRLFTNHCCCCYIKRLIPDWWDRQADLKRSHWPFCQFIAKHFCNFVSLHFCICVSTYAFCICISLHFCICIYLHFRMFVST